MASNCPVWINWVHVAAVAPALGYVFYQNYNGRALPANLAIVGFVVVALILLYHGYQIVAKMTAGPPPPKPQAQQPVPSNALDVDKPVGALAPPPVIPPPPTGFFGQAPLPVGSIYEAGAKF